MFLSYNSASVLCVLVVVFELLFSFSVVFSGCSIRQKLPPESTILKLNKNSKTTTRTHNTEAEF
jgi:hypothetical protein